MFGQHKLELFGYLKKQERVNLGQQEGGVELDKARGRSWS